MSIDVKKALKDLGFKYKDTGRNVKVICWNPRHKENEPSVSIDTEEGIYHCFGCGITGHILSLVKDRLGLSSSEITKYVSNQVKGGETEDEVHDFLLARMQRKAVAPTSIECLELSHTSITEHAYLMGRGFTSDEITKWKMGVVNQPGHPCNGWIYIPISQKGVLQTWFCRCPYGSGKIYGYYYDNAKQTIIGYKRNNVLFGIDDTITTRELYITEGIFDKIMFDRVRVQTVACLSNRLLPEQIKILKRYKSIVLVLDNDIKKRDEGLLLAHSARILLSYTKVWVCILPLHRKDVNECTLDELLQSKYHLISLIDFISTERYINWISEEIKKHE